MSESSSVEAAIHAVQQGRSVIVLDEDDPGYPGGFVCAAELATPKVVNFLVTQGKSVLCCAVLPDTARRLDLTPTETRAPPHAAYGSPVDLKSTHSGMTAKDRAQTLRALAATGSVPADFIRPGHVYPVIAKEGGVLRRAGHAEAGVDLARLAGFSPAAAAAPILNDAGEIADLDELRAMAKIHDLEIITIQSLIRHRRRSERLVRRIAEAQLPTERGPFRVLAYDVLYEAQQPVALAMGDLPSAEHPLVRIHSSCFTGDLLASLRCDCGEQLEMSLAMIAEEGVGVVVYLPQEGRGIGLTEKIKAYHLQDQGMDTVEANLALGHEADLRDYGVGIQILKDLGLTDVRLMTNNPKKTDAFIYGGYDLRVVDQIPIVPTTNEHNANYIATKRDKMGHILP